MNFNGVMEMVKKISNNEETQVIIIDPGYGDWKFIFGSKIGKVSTSIKRSEERALSFGLNKVDSVLNRDEFLFNGAKWYVGNAIAEMGALSSRDYTFIEKFAPLLAYKCFEDSGININNPIKIKTCLSLLDFKNQAESFKKALSVINVNNKVINCEVEVYPQGFVSFIDYASSTGISEYSGLYTATNIGYNSVDFVAILDGEVTYATANPNGVNVMIKELKQYLEDKFKTHFNEKEVKPIFIQGYLDIAGKRIDLSDIIATIKLKYFDTFFHSLPDVNDYFRKAKVNVLAGGGVYYLEDAELADNMAFVNQPYEFSDARGTLNYE